MKKVFAVLLVCMFLITLVGCGGGGGGEKQPANEPPQEEKPFKVGLLVPGSINDKGWNASAYQGLMLIQQELGAEVSYVEAGNPGDMKDSFRDYGEKGYDLVFGHGFQYQDAAAEVAPDYPDTIFITQGGSIVGPNQSPIEQTLETVNYATGIMSAKLSKTQKAGLIGGVDIPAVSKTLRAFDLGAKSINPNFETMITYVGSWDDVNAGYEAALAQIQKGADIIYCNGNAVGLGALKACQEKGVMCFGMSTDQSDLCPDTMIGSVVQYMDKSYLAVAKQVKDGTFKPGVQRVGWNEGVCGFIWNDKFKGEIPQDVKDVLQQVHDDVNAGKLHVPGETE